jgi:hypothetical protein
MGVSGFKLGPKGVQYKGKSVVMKDIEEKEILRCQLYLEHFTQILPYDSRPTTNTARWPRKG